MKAHITIVGSDIHASLDPAEGREARIALSDETISRLKGWAGKYDRAVRTRDPFALVAIGTEMFAWLDESAWASAWAKGEGDRYLEIAGLKWVT